MMLTVYALVDVPALGIELAGITAEPLRMIAAGTVNVVVGEVAAPPTPSSAAAVAYDAIIKRIAGVVPAILPVRFGTLLADEKAVLRIVDARREELETAFSLVRGRVQMTIRLSGKPGAPPPAPSPGETADPSAGPGTRYLQERLRAQQRTQSVPELEPLRGKLSRFVVAERAERHEKPPWFASVYHLVDREVSAEYLETVRTERGVFEEHGIVASPSGPWPPYAFAPESMS